MILLGSAMLGTDPKFNGTLELSLDPFINFIIVYFGKIGKLDI